MKRIALTTRLVLTVTLATLVAPVASAADGAPRAMPTDYAKNQRNEAKQYGVPRAMPRNYAAAGVTVGHQIGLPRATPSDYAAAGIDARPAHTGRRSNGISDSSSDLLVALAVGFGGAVLLTAFTLAVLRNRRGRFVS